MFHLRAILILTPAMIICVSVAISGESHSQTFPMLSIDSGTNVNAIAAVGETRDWQSQFSPSLSHASATATKDDEDSFGFSHCEGTALALTGQMPQTFAPAASANMIIMNTASNQATAVIPDDDEPFGAFASAGATFQVDAGATPTVVLHAAMYLAELGDGLAFGDGSFARLAVTPPDPPNRLSSIVMIGASEFRVDAEQIGPELWRLTGNLPGGVIIDEETANLNRLFYFEVSVPNQTFISFDTIIALPNGSIAHADPDGFAELQWTFASGAWGYLTDVGQTPLVADINGDGSVNNGDFQIIVDSGPIDFGATTPQGDADGDGDIDFDDLDLWLDNTTTSGIPGDYNGDLRIDAADYTVWRDTLGSTADLRANGDDSETSMGIVDEADYAFWKLHFGETDAFLIGSASAISVPEPTVLFMVGVLVGMPRWPLRKH